jgi:hypothetical protein
MAEANLAYEEGNEHRLRAILEEYESSPEAVMGDGAGAELVRVIRKIVQVKRRLTEIEEQVRKLMKSDLSALKGRVEEGKQQGRDILNEMARAVSIRIDETRAVLKKESEGRDK